MLDNNYLGDRRYTHYCYTILHEGGEPFDIEDCGDYGGCEDRFRVRV